MRQPYQKLSVVSVRDGGVGAALELYSIEAVDGDMKYGGDN